MCQSVDAVPPPAVELTFESNAEPLVGGARLDLDDAVPRHQRPQGTVTVSNLEQHHPEEVVHCLWEERHRPQKIHDRRVGVQTELKKPPLQPEERHRLVKGGHQPHQDHDLVTSSSGTVEERRSLFLETKQLVLGETQGALHRIPNHPQEREVGHGDEAGLLPIDDEARLDQQKESLL
jgi:hypothetical protein